MPCGVAIHLKPRLCNCELHLVGNCQHPWLIMIVSFGDSLLCVIEFINAFFEKENMGVDETEGNELWSLSFVSGNHASDSTPYFSFRCVAVDIAALQTPALMLARLSIKFTIRIIE
jgi:hypothetical protein